MPLNANDLDDIELEAITLFERWWAEFEEKYYGPQMERAVRLALAVTPPDVMQFMEPGALERASGLLGGRNGSKNR